MPAACAWLRVRLRSATAMKIKGTSAFGSRVYDDRWVAAHMAEIAVFLALEDVEAVTIHRESGDHRYEVAPDEPDTAEVDHAYDRAVAEGFELDGGT